MAYLIHRNNEHSYLIHYNKNHSKANGQFISGDGDGDGIINDNKNDKKNKDYFITDSGEKIRKPIKEKDGAYTISQATRKNNAGIRLAYVSPNNLLREGYWINADTGEVASAGNQWWGSPEDTGTKEWSKSMFRRGIKETASYIKNGESYIRGL